jgi:hypothetical protein
MIQCSKRERSAVSPVRGSPTRGPAIPSANYQSAEPATSHPVFSELRNADLKRARRKVSGKTKAAVVDKLREVHNALEPILKVIGAGKLRELTADDVRQALATMAARYSTAAVSMGHLALKRAIRQ